MQHHVSEILDGSHSFHPYTCMAACDRVTPGADKKSWVQNDKQFQSFTTDYNVSLLELKINSGGG